MVAMRASCIMRLPRQFFFRIRLNYIMNALNGFALVLVPLPRQKPPYIPYFQRKYWCKNAVYRITPSWMGWALWGWLCDNVAHAIMRVRHATHTHTYTAHISCMNNDTFYGLAFTCFLYNLLSVAIIHAKETHTHATTAHRSFRSERMKHNAIKWHQIQAVISMSFTVFFFAFFCYFICFFVHWISCKRPINKLNSLPDVINVCLACPYGRWANGLGNGHCRVASIWWFIESWLVSLCA